MESTTHMILVPALRIATLSSLAFTSGVSCCMSVWIMPLIMKAPPRVGVKQFNETVYKGEKYLQTGARAMTIGLASLLFLTYKGSYATIPHEWTAWALATCMLVPIAPYEIIFIFPINNRINAIGQDLERQRASPEAEERKRPEMNNLLRKWQLRNSGRFLPPIVASVMVLSRLLIQ